MRTILCVIDSIGDWTGKVGRWLCLAVVLVMTYEVVMRYLFNSPTMWAYETSMMIGGTMYALAFSYTHRHHGHIRIDIFYANLSPRKKAIIDVIGTLFLFLPVVILYTYTAYGWAWQSWVTDEKMIETYWYPPAAPLRTMVALGFFLLVLQGGAQLIRDSYLLIRNKTYD